MRHFLRTISLATLTLGVMASPASAAQTIEVGAYPANPPWEYKTEAGTFEGFEIDLVNDIAKKLGADLHIQDLGFQALFAATGSHRIDMAISSISITQDRLKNQAFTQGYYDSDLALISNASSKVKTLADTKGATLGAISNSVGEAWIKANTAKYGIAAYKGYNTQQDLLLDTQNGRVDGAVGDIAGFLFAFRKMPGLHLDEEIPTGDKFGIMMPKGSPLLEKVNAAISALKTDGTLPAIYKKYFGVAPGPDSSTVKVLPLPAAE